MGHASSDGRSRSRERGRLFLCPRGARDRHARCSGISVRIASSTHRGAHDARGSIAASMRGNASARMSSTPFRCARDAPRMARNAFWSSRKSAQSGLCGAKKSLPGKISESIHLSFGRCRRRVAASCARDEPQLLRAEWLADKTTLKTTFLFWHADAGCDRARPPGKRVRRISLPLRGAFEGRRSLFFREGC